MMTFFSFLAISITEFILWCLYLTTDNVEIMEYFDIYTRTVGYYGSISLYGLPVIFAILQAYVQDGGDLRVSPGAYCLWLIWVGGIYWLFNMWIHITFAPRLKAYVAARKAMAPQTKKEFKCPLLKTADMT